MSEAEIDYLRTKLQEAEAEKDLIFKRMSHEADSNAKAQVTIADQKALLDEIIANAQLVQATPNPDSGDAYLIDCEVIEKINKLQEVK